MSLSAEYPLWFVIFCCIAGFSYAFILYRKAKSLSDLSVGLVRILAAFRFIVISVLSFFLLSPLLKTVNRNVEKPVIIIAQDNSESIVAGKDSIFYNKEYKQNLNKLIDDLSIKYEVKTYSFSDKFMELKSTDSIKYNKKQTDISSLFEEIETRFSNRNAGAVIIATDGLFNKGSNPLYSSGKIKIPIYTIALGDTAIKKDIILTKINNNRLAYFGNKFPIEVVVKAKRLKGKTTTLTISKGSALLFSQILNFNSDAFISNIPILLDAKEIGLQHYKVKLSSLDEEMSVSNNERDVFIDVLDAREKIVILADAPHPDIAALKDAIESSQNYEVETYLLDNFDKPLKKYNLVVLYQLPTVRNPATRIITEINRSNIPTWVFSGSGNIIKTNLSAVNSNQKTNECEPILDNNFPLFTISDELRKGVKDFPAVTCPFDRNINETTNNVLLYQRIGMVDAKIPLMLFTVSSETKMAIFEGEGVWRWRLQDFASHGNHKVFDELVSKTVQYLSVKVDKSFFKVITKNNFLENEAIEMEAEVYNQSYELINESDVNITITNSDNMTFPFTFSKASNAYRLNVGMMSVGDYKYEAKVKLQDKMYTQKGSFSVSALQLEMVNTVADHHLLYSLSAKHGGEMVYPNELNKLVKQLNLREDIKSVSYSEKRLIDLINLKWIFFLILSLLSFEWFIRKRNGSN